MTLLRKLLKVLHTTRKDNELFFFDSSNFSSTHVPPKKLRKIDGKWRESRPHINTKNPIFLRFHFTVARRNIFPPPQRERIMSSWVNRSLSLSLSPFFLSQKTRKSLYFTAMCQLNRIWQENECMEVNRERNWNLKCLHDTENPQSFETLLLCTGEEGKGVYVNDVSAKKLTWKISSGILVALAIICSDVDKKSRKNVEEENPIANVTRCHPITSLLRNVSRHRWIKMLGADSLRNESLLFASCCRCLQACLSFYSSLN